MVHKWRLAIYFPSQLDFPKVRPKEKLISDIIELGDITENGGPDHKNFEPVV
jgi:hypothetical protein